MLLIATVWALYKYLANLVKSSLFVMNAFFMNMLWGETSFSSKDLGLGQKSAFPWAGWLIMNPENSIYKNLKGTAEFLKNQEIATRNFT